VAQEPSDRACLGIMLRTCQALRQLHQAGFVHCDFKPDNALLEMGEDGEPQEVHVIDLGLACRVGHAFPRACASNQPWYCPCFFDGAAMQARCDLVGLAYTLGIFRDVMSCEHEELDALLQRAFDAQHGRRWRSSSPSCRGSFGRPGRRSPRALTRPKRSRPQE